MTLAMVAKNLDMFSSNEISHIARSSCINLSASNLDHAAVLKLENKAIHEISIKSFLHESDRVVASGIICGSMAKRALADAIRRSDIPVIRTKLNLLKGRNLLPSLNHPLTIATTHYSMSPLLSVVKKPSQSCCATELILPCATYAATLHYNGSCSQGVG